MAGKWRVFITIVNYEIRETITFNDQAGSDLELARHVFHETFHDEMFVFV